MAKTVARISNGVVINLEIVTDATKETDCLRNTYDLPLEIGDTYSNGHFYHEGREILTYREQLQKMISDYDSALTEISAYISVPLMLAEGEEFTIEKRKQAILARVADMLDALNALN